MLDLVNLIYILSILMIIYKYYKFNQLYFIILLGHLLLIFFINDVLFPASYMPDQFSYLKVAQNVRELNFLAYENFYYGYTVYFPGIFFGLFPIPFIDSLYSIGMINFLVYLYIFCFLYKKGFLNSKFIAYFYLLFPSLAMYSCLALREILIFTIMFFGIYYLIIKRNYWVGFGILMILKFVKFQNLLIITTAFIMSLINLRKLNIKQIILGLLIFFGIFMVFRDFFSIEQLNHYREVFYSENKALQESEFVPLKSLQDLIIHALPSSIYMLFRPLPWEEYGMLQVMQFLENCIIFTILIAIVYKNIKHQLFQLDEIKFLNILFLLGLVIYGLVSFNSGTAVRYKFPFIMVYIIYSWAFIYQRERELCAE